MPEFKFIDRGFKNTILLLPGWAADYRIFAPVHFEFNYLLPIGCSPFSFEKDLLDVMGKKSLKKLSILGWSMGAFMACDFLSGHRDMIDDLVLVGARPSYEKQELENIKVYLKKNRRAFLYAFYRDCFSPGEAGAYGWFRSTLLETYLDKMGPDTLLEGLDYISDRRIEAKLFPGIKIVIVHGAEDRIAPIEEVRKLKEALPEARFIIMGKTGHMPFLNPDFSSICYEAIKNG